MADVKSSMGEIESVKENERNIRLLGSVMLRLGDANLYKDEFEGGLQDYHKCLEHRKFTEDPKFSRDLAEM